MTIADHELREWAREHLVYEGRMLAYAGVQLANLRNDARGPESNALLECFLIHVRCIGDFFWSNRGRQREDAFATDFCHPGVWNEVRPVLPAALAEIKSRNRAGREIVHLTYHRSAVTPAEKDWPVSSILNELIDGFDLFVVHALPERLDGDTREALSDLSNHFQGVGPKSVATGVQLEYVGGTAAFPGFQGS